jgi:hypothetical protein
LQKSTGAVQTQPWSSIDILGQTTSSNDGRTDVLMLFIRSPKPAVVSS